MKEASATLAGAQADNQEILVAMDAGTYNVRKATCTLYCISCNDTTYVYTVLNRFAVAVGGQTSLTAMGQQNTGGAYQLYGASWSSSNTRVATVGASTGVVSGIAAGAVTMYAAFQSSPWYNSYYCSYNYPYCPYYTVAQSSGGGTVQVPTSLRMISASVVPNNTVSGCLSTDYGIVLAIEYQVLDQYGKAMTAANMEPQEKVLNVVVNRLPPGNPYPNWKDVGSSTYPGSSKYADSTGQFLDAPFGVCTNFVFVETLTQPISILLNGVNYPVRTSYWTTQGVTPGHGNVTNATDITQSR